MKVLLVSARYEPHAVGGAERVTRTLANTLRNQGLDVVVLTTAVAPNEADRVVDGIRVRPVAVKNLYDFSASPPRALKAVWHAIDSFNPLMRASVERVIREERPDVVHTHLITGFSPSVWGAAAACAVPVIHTLHDHYLLCVRSTMAIDGRVCERQHLECALLSAPRVTATRSVNAVVGVSQFILDRHLAYRTFGGARTAVIPNPCHLVGATRSSTNRVAPDAPLRLGFLGRIEANKGIEFLLDSLRDVPSGWTLSVAGEGRAEFVEPLRSRFASGVVSFVGQVDPADFLSRVDLLVLPSLVPETFGLSGAEAMAMGVPVLASTRGALPELITEGRNGFLFDPDVGRALTDVLSRLVSNPGAVRAMAGACIASAERFAPSRIAVQYRGVYETVI